MDAPTPDLASWIGRTETATDTIGRTPVLALNATLDHPPMLVGDGTPLPPLWHCLYFLDLHRQCELGPDGHARRGEFLPPVALPRRMWAGSEVELRSPIWVGDRVSRTSTVVDVEQKSGRSGPLVFVKVRHELRREGAPEPALIELHDIVYRAARAPGEPMPPPQPAGEGVWQREVVADAVLLFRYSALTFNGHRIHYDRRFATEHEGYPGLVVHGPLVATLLLDLVQRHAPGADVARFRFKALRPLFDVHPFRIHGEPQPDGTSIRLWAQDHTGALAVEGTAGLRQPL